MTNVITMSEPLPPEALSQLLKYIPSTELQGLRMVSSNWKEFIEKEYGITVLISNDNWHWICNSKGVRIATFHSFTRPFSSTVPFILDLQEIIFHRIVLTCNLISILQKCTQIRKLSFTQIILDQTNQILVPFNIRLPQLTVLQIHIPYGGDISQDDINIMKFLSEIIYEKLEEFCFWCPNLQLKKFTMKNFSKQIPTEANNNIQDISYSFLNILQKNRSTIDFVQLGPWKLPVNMIFIPQLNKIFIEKPIQFEVFQVPCEIPEYWRTMITTQHYLKCFHLKQNAFSLWYSSSLAIQQSCEMIQEIILIDETHIAGEIKQQIRLDIFKNCCVLTKLIMKFKLGSSYIHSECLPTSLKYLELKGYLEKSQFQSLSSNLINLEILKIDNCERMRYNRITEDESPRNGIIDVHTFRKLVNLPKMKEITLENCSMNWSPILNWCVFHSVPDCVMKASVKTFQGNPFSLHAEITAHY